jgi:hypothetical protein
MRSFVGWVTNRPYRLILLTIVFVQVLAPVAGALLVLDVLHRGPAAATVAALIALGAIGLSSLAVGASLADSVGLAAPILLGGLVSGALLRASRSLSLAYQATVLGAIALMLAVFALVPGADRFGQYLLDETLNLLRWVLPPTNWSSWRLRRPICWSSSY